jgi:hypothetical protein
MALSRERVKTFEAGRGCILSTMATCERFFVFTMTLIMLIHYLWSATQRDGKLSLWLVPRDNSQWHSCISLVPLGLASHYNRACVAVHSRLRDSESPFSDRHASPRTALHIQSSLIRSWALVDSVCGAIIQPWNFGLVRFSCFLPCLLAPRYGWERDGLRGFHRYRVLLTCVAACLLKVYKSGEGPSGIRATVDCESRDREKAGCIISFSY